MRYAQARWWWLVQHTRDDVEQEVALVAWLHPHVQGIEKAVDRSLRQMAQRYGWHKFRDGGRQSWGHEFARTLDFRTDERVLRKPFPGFKAKQKMPSSILAARQKVNG